MHQYASECIKIYHNVCRMNYFNVLCIKFQFEKFQFFWLEMINFFSKCSECINMHQNASKCVQNEMCKCFVHENIKKWVYIAFKGAKISKILVTLCDGRPCRLENATDVIHFNLLIFRPIYYKISSRSKKTCQYQY